MPPASEAVATLGALRRVLLAILLLGMAITTVDLWLMGHDEDTKQVIPLALLGAGFAVIAWNSARRSRRSVTCLQIVMVLFVASGLLGMYFHYDANVQFQLEMDPDLTGGNL